MALLTGGQPVLASYNRRDIEAGRHFLEIIEQDENIDLVIQEILDATEEVYDIDFDVALDTEGITTLPTELDDGDTQTDSPSHPWEDDHNLDELPGAPEFETDDDGNREMMEDERDGFEGDHSYAVFPTSPDFTVPEDLDEDSFERGPWEDMADIDLENVEHLLGFPAIRALADAYGGVEIFHQLNPRAEFLEDEVEHKIYEEGFEQVVDENGHAVLVRVDENGEFVLVLDETTGQYMHIRDENGQPLMRSIRIPVIDEVTGEQEVETFTQIVGITLHFEANGISDTIVENIRAVDTIINEGSPNEMHPTHHGQLLYHFESHNIDEDSVISRPVNSTTGELTNRNSENAFYGATKAELIAAVRARHEDTILGTSEANNRHYSNAELISAEGLMTAEHFAVEEAHYSRHIKVDSDGNIMRFAINPTSEQEVEGVISITQDQADSGIIVLENFDEAGDVTVSLIGGSFRYAEEYANWPTNFQASWATAGTGSVGALQNWLGAAGFGFRLAPDQSIWHTLNGGNLNDLAPNNWDTSLANRGGIGDVINALAVGESLTLVSNNYNSALTVGGQVFPNAAAAPNGLVWMQLERQNLSGDSQFRWQKGVMKHVEEFHAVSYTTMVNIETDKEFEAVKFFDPIAFDVPMGEGLAVGIEETPPTPTPPPPTPGPAPTPDPDPTPDPTPTPEPETVDYEMEPEYEFVTGAENTYLPATGDSASLLGLAGLGALGAGGAAMLNKKRRKKNKKNQ